MTFVLENMRFGTHVNDGSIAEGTWGENGSLGSRNIGLADRGMLRAVLTPGPSPAGGRGET